MNDAVKNSGLSVQSQTPVLSVQDGLIDFGFRLRNERSSYGCIFYLRSDLNQLFGIDNVRAATQSFVYCLGQFFFGWGNGDNAICSSLNQWLDQLIIIIGV